jgi:hypothetical protein
LKPTFPLVLGAAGLIFAAPTFAQDLATPPAAGDTVNGASGDATNGQDNAALLDEIQSLRRQVTDLESLKARLEKLETQVAGQAKTQAAAAAKLAAPPIKFSGFVQARFENNLARNPHTDFFLRRARLKLQADPTPWAGAVLQVDAANANVTPLDAFVDLKAPNGGWYLRAGQFRVPFGYEAFYESSSTRLAPERSRAIVSLFPNSVRDRGVFVAREVKGKPSFYLGALNGSGINGRDNNNAKDYLAHAEIPIGKTTSLGVSGYTGKFTTVAANGARTDTDRDFLGANVQAILGPVELHGEYVSGKNLGANIDGGYLQAALPTSRTPGGTPFLKYDWYDPNHSKAKDSFSRWTLGYAFELDKATRLTLTHEVAKDNATSGKDDVTTFQVQVKY